MALRKSLGEQVGRGTLWQADDRKYIASGNIIVEGRAYKVFVYDNDYKNGNDKAPDFNLNILELDHEEEQALLAREQKYQDKKKGESRGFTKKESRQEYDEPRRSRASRDDNDDDDNREILF